MKVIPTQKLFFNRFTHCVKISVIGDKKLLNRNGDSKFSNIKKWLLDNSIQHRTRLDWYSINQKTVDLTLGIFFSDESAYRHFLDNYSDDIKWVSKPINSTHQELLLNKTEIEFKEKLYYKNFRYKILFKSRWQRERRAELINEIKQLVDQKQHGKKLDYFLINNWSPSIYLKCDNDVVMFKLSMSDEIKKVVKVELFAEHGVTPESIKP